MSVPPDSSVLVARLQEVGAFVAEHRYLWAPRPFTGLPIPWEERHPEVSRALRALPEGAVDLVEHRPWELEEAPARYGAWAEEARRLSTRPLVEATPLAGPRPRGVKARKWEQVRRFGGAVLARRPETVRRWVDWCSGKGHLGRALSKASGLPVRCVEARGDLCDAGEALADAEGVAAEYLEADVLEAEEEARTEGDAGIVALHACGDLHVDLIRRAAAEPPPYLAVAPCCYHRSRAASPEPLSEAARRGPGLRLERHELRLVGLDEVIAPSRLRRRRRREQAYRLGLDLLLRETTGVDEYRALGSAPSSWLEGSFERFCLDMATRAGLELPPRWDAAAYEAAGRERHRVVRALALVRGLFRAPIEQWLLLDRALVLAEAGLHVTLAAFCSDAVTPRNALILATPRGPATGSFRPQRIDGTLFES